MKGETKMKTIYMVNTGASDDEPFGVIAFTSLKKVARWFARYLMDFRGIYMDEDDLCKGMEKREEEGWVSLLERDDLPESVDVVVYSSSLDEEYE